MKVLNFQQGGMITAPNPQPYRMPLQGLDPNAFQFKLQSTPIDSSGLIQVMQFKENADLRRLQEATALERLKIQKEIDEAKLDHEKQKLAFQKLEELNKMSKSVGGKSMNLDGKEISPLYNYNYFKNAYQEPLAKVQDLKSQLTDVIAMDNLDANSIRKIQSLNTQLQDVLGSMATKSDIVGAEKLLGFYDGIFTKDAKFVKKGEELFMPAFNEAFNKLHDALNSTVPGTTLPGLESIPMYAKYDPESEAKALDALAVEFLSTSKFDEVSAGVVGSRGNYIQKTTKERVVNDYDSVSNGLVDYITSNMSAAAYISNLTNTNLFTNGYTEVDRNLVKNIVDKMFMPKFESVAKGASLSKEISIQAMASEPKPDTNVNFKTSGSTTKNINNNRTGGDNKTSTSNVPEATIEKINELTGSTGIQSVAQSILDKDVVSDSSAKFLDNITKLPVVQQKTVEEFIREITEKGVDINDPYVIERITNIFGSNFNPKSESFKKEKDKLRDELIVLFTPDEDLDDVGKALKIMLLSNKDANEAFRGLDQNTNNPLNSVGNQIQTQTKKGGNSGTNWFD